MQHAEFYPTPDPIVEYLAEANQRTLDTIGSGNIPFDSHRGPTDHLGFYEIGIGQPHPDQRGIILELYLVEGSPLTNAILTVLEQYKKGDTYAQ